MNAQPKIERHPSTCPHDCPSACSLQVEVIDGKTIGRVHGDPAQSYTAGVICAKVARYAERIHHPDRLLHPLIRKGPKGSGEFQRISWDEALAMTAERFLEAEKRYGSETVWPYYYAGTMGFVQRDGINRLRHAKNYSGFFSTICVNMAWSGFIAGTGRLAGVDPREMAKSDVVVIWGTNPVSTQVNVMTHAMKARKERGAKIVVIDLYRTDTLKQADLGLVVRPGTDGALACAVMHVLFRDGFADREYLRDFTDVPEELESHLQSRDPAWAAAITGLTVEEIEAFAKLVGENKRTYLRLGYGFGRQRNGAVNMHAASCIAAVTGSWKVEGGGAFHNNGAIYHWRKSLIEGLDIRNPRIRMLDQSRIGPILVGEPDALRRPDGSDGPPVTALLIQNTNPVNVAPEQAKVVRGFAREDLFTVVHEQFMTDTAKMADLVLPATQFMEHDDMYQGGGHQHIMLGLKLVEPPGECRSNHDLICDLARRLGAEHEGFAMNEREIIDWTLQNSGWGTFDELATGNFRDVQPSFEEAHYLKGFAYGDKRFKFKPDWPKVPFANIGPLGPWKDMPGLPDHWAVTEEPDAEHPFKLATSPARSFLNSTFVETPSSKKREGRPEVMINPADAARLAIADGAKVELGNVRGTVILHAKLTEQTRAGTLVAEGIWPNDAHEGGRGINTLTSADAVAPFGGAAFHDNKAWIRPL
ncbi:molybdopterin oxidoreductase family protein [Phreatobacter aquaticus]|uniref:Molybdopterin oxidoreductase family protein n=1 Tax=Phreatobacter aquaticus TaxID=2570229 RepID=A0A4D7QN34_9HYPH|nr:molybdopterin oxidoreductase family protein [Phreatobacter aquaticus]QCK87029.1 molybdopterin oxidoreductase family protein [Phreatobacter aquaticus]